MKYLIAFAIFLAGCQSPAHKINLTGEETKRLDSLQFDKALASELKVITGQTFNVMSVVNESGKEIPASMLPKMITFSVDEVSTESIEKLKKEYVSQYNIYVIDGKDGKKQVIASKL